VVGGKHVCLKVGLPCLVKYQALYRGKGYVCGASKRLGILVCTGGTVYAVIGGVHGCMTAGKTCLTKYATQYAQYGFTCAGGKLARPKPINAKIAINGPEQVVYPLLARKLRRTH
jgi:hypothetical protein